MKTKIKVIISIAVVIVLLLVWAPWITKEYAISRVIEKEGFPNLTVGLADERDISVTWIPLGKFISTYEHGWFVTFYGQVI
jgi:hypothetical protein